MKMNAIEKGDRISELPDYILHHILSFLSFRQVAKTCVLSKTWERAWRTYPVLEFDREAYSYYPPADFFSHARAIVDLEIRIKRSLNCFEQTLRNRISRELAKFTFEMDLFDDPELVSLVDRCVSYAILSNVEELELEFLCWDEELYHLPQVVLLAKSIKLLKLCGCKLELPRGNVELHSLRKLCLFNVYVDDHLIKNLVSRCPLLEDLSFSSCQGFKSLELFGLNRLTEVQLAHMCDLERLDIKASNVQLLTIVWSDFVPITGPHEINFAFCVNLKSLSLSRAPITNEWLCNQISKFPNLEYLSIHHSRQLTSIKISSHFLKTLSVAECYRLVELKIDTPNLRFLHYKGDMITICVNALALSNVYLEFPSRSIESLWCVEYVQFLAKFHCVSEVLNLRSDMYEIVIVLRELRQILNSPLSSIKHLNLILYKIPVRVTEIVDGLLWIAPHSKMISIEYSISNKSLKFTFTYKKQLIYEGEVASCCKCYPISCWQHCIEEIEFEITDADEKGEKDIKTYTLKGADIMEKIDLRCGDGSFQNRSI